MTTDFVIQTVELVIARYPNSKRIAVENFVMSADVTSNFGNDYLNNLSADAISYKWNTDTVSAIKEAFVILSSQNSRNNYIKLNEI